jgi:glycosyltransferase involved in cell wall biosynthesis
MKLPRTRRSESSANGAGHNGTLPASAPGRERPALVSVVIPVLNGERYIRDQLEALERQTYDGQFEVVVVDNGSTDRTLEIVESFGARLPWLRVADASAQRGLNHARNRGAQAAAGDFIAFCDADDRVDPGWLAAMAEAARGADIVGGALEFDELNHPVHFAWRPSESLTELPLKHDFLLALPGGNCGVWTEVAHSLGWDTSFTFGSSDIEWSWRAQLAGHTLAFAPGAVVQARFRTRKREVSRQWYEYGKSGGWLYRTFRAHGMPRSSSRDAFREWRWLARHAGHLAGAAEQRGYWIRLASYRFGRVVGSVRWRVLFL